MSLAAIIDALVEAGATPQMIAAAARAHEAATPARSKHAEAQARYKARKEQEQASPMISDDQRDQQDQPKEKAPQTPKKENPLPKENPPKGGQKKKVRPSRTRIDPESSLTDEFRETARRAGMPESDVPREFRRFVDHHAAKGSEMADWLAAWRTWLGNWQRFNGKTNVVSITANADPPRKAAEFTSEENAEIARIRKIPDPDEARRVYSEFLANRQRHVQAV